MSKQPICKVCKKPFTRRYTSTQRVCGIECGIIDASTKRHRDNEKQLKSDRKALRASKNALRTKSWYLAKAQQAINKYVRLRDQGKPCCSCDKPDDGSHQRHASHFRSVAACSALRFNLKNISTSCQQCNTSLSGNLLEYRIRLVKKYGAEYVEFLECENQVVRYDIEYLKRLKSVFSKKCRMIENRL